MDGPRSRGYGARSGYDVRTRRLRGSPEGRDGVNRDIQTATRAILRTRPPSRNAGRTRRPKVHRRTFRRASALALSVEPAHQHVFELDELPHAMARAFAANA